MPPVPRELRACRLTNLLNYSWLTVSHWTEYRSTLCASDKCTFLTPMDPYTEHIGHHHGGCCRYPQTLSLGWEHRWLQLCIFKNVHFCVHVSCAKLLITTWVTIKLQIGEKWAYEKEASTCYSITTYKFYTLYSLQFSRYSTLTWSDQHAGN